MNYKSLSLAALLLPFSGYGINKNEARIKELKEAEYNKALELQSLSVKIREIASQYYDHEEYNYFLDVAMRKTGKQEDELYNENLKLQDYLTNCLLQNKDVGFDLSKELFYKDAAFDAYKGLFVESAIEKCLLAIMTERLKKCWNELVQIKKELNNL